MPGRQRSRRDDPAATERSGENNLLAATSIRYGGYGGIACRHVSNTYIALFSHFIPCAVWEAVYIIEGLLKNASDVQPDTIHQVRTAAARIS